MQGAGGGARGPRAQVQVGARRAQSLWGSSFSVRAGARPAAECAEGRRVGAGSGGARRLLGERWGWTGGGMPWNPGAEPPCSQECNGSVSLVALIPSSAQAQLCGCRKEQAESWGGGVPSDERAQGRRVWCRCDAHCGAGWGRERGQGGEEAGPAANSGLRFCPQSAGVLVPRSRSAPGYSLDAGKARPPHGWLRDTFLREASGGLRGQEKGEIAPAMAAEVERGSASRPQIHGVGGG